MSEFTRYAIFYAPEAGSDLARFGAAWLGWDCAAGRPAAHPEVGIDVAALTVTPRRYGFHGTLKPPFRLAEGRIVAELGRAAEALASGIAAFEAPPLALRRLGAFLALVPSAPCPALDGLARASVERLDRFRAPAPPEETARRRAAGLSARQEAMLARWGYPFVLDEFRFHLTLTVALDPAAAEAAMAVLAPLTAPFCAAPLPVREICLVGEMASGHFRLLERYPLTG